MLSIIELCGLLLMFNNFDRKYFFERINLWINWRIYLYQVFQQKCADFLCHLFFCCFPFVALSFSTCSWDFKCSTRPFIFWQFDHLIAASWNFATNSIQICKPFKRLVLQWWILRRFVRINCRTVEEGKTHVVHLPWGCFESLFCLTNQKRVRLGPTDTFSRLWP